MITFSRYIYYFVENDALLLVLEETKYVSDIFNVIDYYCWINILLLVSI